MKSLNEYMNEYRKQIEKGDINRAYKGLMEYIMSLRTYFKNKYSEDFIVGSMYQGYMDMTYFPFSSKALRDKKLKVALVFSHEEVRFEAWLAGNNKQIQRKYWELIKENNLNKYVVPSSIEGNYSIAKGVLVDEPNFNDLESLTEEIEKGTLEFIEDVQEFLG